MWTKIESKFQLQILITITSASSLHRSSKNIFLDFEKKKKRSRLLCPAVIEGNCGRSQLHFDILETNAFPYFGNKLQSLISFQYCDNLFVKRRIPATCFVHTRENPYSRRSVRFFALRGIPYKIVIDKVIFM